MQASKHSPQAKKSNPTQSGQKSTNSEKSIAQLVMDVTLPQQPKEDTKVTNSTSNSINKKPILKSSSTFNKDNIDQLQINQDDVRKESDPKKNDSQMKLSPNISDQDVVGEFVNNKNQLVDNNKIIDNQEVSDALPRNATENSKPDLMNLTPSNGSQPASSNKLERDPSRLILNNINNDETNKLSQSLSKPSATNNELLVSCQSVFNKVINNNMKPPDEDISPIVTTTNNLQASPANCGRSTRISLETRVPHPNSKQIGFQSEEEGPGYLNLGVHNLNNRTTCSSLDNTTKPILLAAAREQRLGSQPKTAASFQHLRPSNIIQLQQHQFSGELRPSPPAIVNQHEYEAMYDEYDAHYGNALVERRIRQKELEDERQQQQALRMSTNDGNSNDCSTGNDGQLIDGATGCSSSASVPASPKAKSAPATPCNMTPTAFHQHNPNNIVPQRGATIGGQLSGMDETNRNACRTLSSNQQLQQQQQQPELGQNLNELIELGDKAMEIKDYEAAVGAFSHCIELTIKNQSSKKNFKIYAKRAEAHLQLGNYREAIEDSRTARDLNPKWTQAYLLQGRAQFHLGDYDDSLAVFSFGLCQEPSNKDLFEALVDAALKSSYKQDFEPKYDKLRSINLGEKPFIVVSLLGQELLSKGKIKHAAIILESAFKLEQAGEDKKLKSSVLSSIAYAFCALRDYEKAIAYMEREMEIESDLEDVGAQCRVLSNLGFTYYKVHKFDKSLEVHRRQLNLAMKSNLYQQASTALTAIGHVHVARNDFLNALTSHTRCLDILRQLAEDYFSQFKELLSMGHVCSMMNDLKTAEDRYKEADQFLDTNQSKLSQEEFNLAQIMLRFNMAHVSLKKQNYGEARDYYGHVIRYAHELDKSNHRLAVLYEMRAYNGLGHTSRLLKRFDEARSLFKQQLQLAQSLGDLEGQSQALCNLGMTCQHFKEHVQARRYFEDNLRLVERVPLLRAYAHSYMGSAHFLLGHYNDAQAHYESSLGIFKKLEYCTTERKTIDLNLAFVRERIGHQDLSYANSPNELATTPNIATTQNGLTSSAMVSSATTLHQKRVMMAT